MAFIKFKNIGIGAINACVPKKIEKNISLTDIFNNNNNLQDIIKTIGINERRIADYNVTASDLCYFAAKNLLNELNIDKSTIDILIFMSQFPDYRIPATAPSLQHRLGLSKTTAAFDINLSCSGYIYALSTAFAYANIPGINKVLLLDGETFSKLVSKRDKVNRPLYGDAGTATIIEKGDFEESYFSLNSDGSGVDVLKIDAGGARNKTTVKNIEEIEVEDGNFRSSHQLFMDGMEVFNFTMMNVPKDIKRLLKFADKNIQEIDLFVFHQANKLMTDFFAKRLKIPNEKLPYSIDLFGNTSSASIPLTISLKLNSKKADVLLSSFGAGLSWASAIINLSNSTVVPLSEYNNEE